MLRTPACFLSLVTPSATARSCTDRACSVRGYGCAGLTWLNNLYEQGINGILADEMGLGKTVQSIALLAHLAEALNIWGPFLVIAPASTLHNWQQEFEKFVPDFKVRISSLHPQKTVPCPGLWLTRTRVRHSRSSAFRTGAL